MRQFKNKLLVSLLSLLFIGNITAQNISINKSGAIADDSAILDLQSDEQGFLVPRMNSTKRGQISSPANGLLVFDVTTNSFWYYESSAWAELNSGEATLVSDDDGDTKIQVEESANENTIRFDTDGNESMVLTSDGELGIGTTPAGIFHVRTDPIAAQQATAASVTSSNTGMYGSSSVYQSFTATVGGLFNSFTVNPNGLHSCSGTITVYSGNGTGGAALGSTSFSYNNTNNSPIVFDLSTLNITLVAGSQYTVRFHGLSSSMRHTGNTDNLHTGGNYYSNVYNSPSGWDMRFIVKVGTPPTAAQDIVISKDGKVGIRNASPVYTLDVNGTVAGTSPYTNSSDRRFKKAVQPLENALDKVLRIKGVSFDWRHTEFPEKNFTQGREIGFIAQDLQPILPEVVNQDNNGYYSVEYANLVPVLVEAVKELNEKLEQANAKLAQQSMQLSSLAKKQGTTKSTTTSAKASLISTQKKK
ncbi:MAG: tail fiber domain-containing protein [Saprospiraceae bacterium]